MAALISAAGKRFERRDEMNTHCSDKGEHSMTSSSPFRRSFFATSAAAGACALVLLAVPCYAQTVPAAVAGSVISLLPVKLHAAARTGAGSRFCKENAMSTTMTQSDAGQDTATDAIRPFHVHFSDEALAD